MDKYFIDYIAGFTCSREKIYFITPYIYAIQEYDCRYKKADILVDFPKEVQKNGAFERIIICGNKIYLFPCLADNIYYFDLENKSYHRFVIPQSILECMPKRKNLEVIEYKTNIYCVCRCPNMVMCIDVKTDDFKIYSMPLEMIEERISMEGYHFSLCSLDNRLLYTFADDIIIEFSTDRKEFKVNYLDAEKSEISQNNCDVILGLCADKNGNLWMYNFEGEVFKVIESMKIKINIPKNLTSRYNDGRHEQPGIDRIFIIDDDLCFALRSQCKILRYNVKTEHITLCSNNLAKWNESGRQVAFFNYAQVDKETIWLYNENDGAFYKWNYIKGFVERVEITLPITAFLGSQSAKDYLYCNIIMRKDLEGYIAYIKNTCEEKKQENDVNHGYKIYHDLNNNNYF